MFRHVRIVLRNSTWYDDFCLSKVVYLLIFPKSHYVHFTRVDVFNIFTIYSNHIIMMFEMMIPKSIRQHVISKVSLQYNLKSMYVKFYHPVF